MDSTSKRALTTGLGFKTLKSWLLKYYKLLFLWKMCAACLQTQKSKRKHRKGLYGSEKNHKNWGNLDSQKKSLSQAKKVCVGDRRKIAALQQSTHGFVYAGWQACTPGLPFCLSQDNASEMVGQVDNCVQWLHIYKYGVFDKVTTGSAFKMWFSKFISYVWI